MNHKMSAALLLLISFQVAASTQLYNHTEIKNKLLKGQSVNAIVELNNGCRMISSSQAAGAPPPAISGTFSFLLEKFVNSPYTGDSISASTSSLNPATQAMPAHYAITGISISSNDRINLDMQTITFETRRMIQKVSYSCNMDDGRGNGVKFF